MYLEFLGDLDLLAFFIWSCWGSSLWN